MRKVILFVLIVTLGACFVMGQQAKMTNSDIIQMVSAGLSEQVIIEAVNQAPTRNFDLSTAGLIALKKAHVNDAVIMAMQNSAKSTAPMKSAPVAGLSRQRATELIARNLQLPSTQILKIGMSIKKTWNDPDNSSLPSVRVCLTGESEKYNDVKYRWAFWQLKGLIKIGEWHQHVERCNYLWATAELTDEGKKCFIKDVDKTLQVKVYDMAMGAVTGIQTNDMLKQAEATFTLNKVNATPFSADLSMEPVTGTANFSLWDDGWRLDSVRVNYYQNYDSKLWPRTEPVLDGPIAEGDRSPEGGPAANSKPAPVNPASMIEAYEKGEPVTIAITRDVGIEFGKPYLVPGKITVSKTQIRYSSDSGMENFDVSPDKILHLELLPIDPMKGGWTRIQSAPCISMKVSEVSVNAAFSNKKKLATRYFFFYNAGARIRENARWGMYAGINIVNASGCDDSLSLLSSLLEKACSK